MKQIKVLHLTAALASVLSLNLPAQTLLTSGHTDVGIAFESGAFNLHIGQHEATPPMEYEPGEAILAVDSAHAQSVVPSGDAWSFLGASWQLGLDPSAGAGSFPDLSRPGDRRVGCGPLCQRPGHPFAHSGEGARSILDVRGGSFWHAPPCS